jgi:hypothetical protein
VTKDWPEPSVPQDLAAALAAAPQKIQDLWNKITPMARWEWVRWVNATENPDTRRRRVDVSISKMKSGKKALLFQPLRMYRPGPVEERQAPGARGRPPLIDDPTRRVRDAGRARDHRDGAQAPPPGNATLAILPGLCTEGCVPPLAK